jgi:hypothetical protein
MAPADNLADKFYPAFRRVAFTPDRLIVPRYPAIQFKRLPILGPNRHDLPRTMFDDLFLLTKYVWNSAGFYFAREDHCTAINQAQRIVFVYNNCRILCTTKAGQKQPRDDEKIAHLF